MKRGFAVLPYIHAGPALCKRPEEVGADAFLMSAAITTAGNPVAVATAVEMAVETSRMTCVAGRASIHKMRPGVLIGLEDWRTNCFCTALPAK